MDGFSAGRTITLDGSTISTPVTLNAGLVSRQSFQIASGVQAVITNLNVKNGDANHPSLSNNNGGAIFNAGTTRESNDQCFRKRRSPPAAHWKTPAN